MLRPLASTEPHRRAVVGGVYERLMAAYGPQGWWPADSPFEMIVGAILVQAVAWRNVEGTMAKLKEAGALSPAALRHIPEAELAQLCYSCGYHNAKARKLKAFAARLGEHGDDLEAWLAGPVEAVREDLLSIHGIGPETADSILLYAAGRPTFVIDAMTRRIVDRLGVAPAERTYSGYQRLFKGSLPRETAMYNEYHALLVALAKRHCVKREPRCGGCPVADLCATGRGRADV